MTLTYTKYYRFPKTDFMSEPWIQGIWDSFDAIDALMYGQATANGTTVWMNSTDYVLGNMVIDTADGSTWVCVGAHTSAALPTTMAQDRAANPSYWNVIMLSLKARGQWTNNTAYNPGDMAYDTTSGRNVYGVCTTKHISNAAGTINDDAAYWAFTYNSLAPATASGIGYSNAVSHLVATNVQTAIDEVVAVKAPLASPVFTGNPTAPTAAPGDNDTSIATTAFVQAAGTAIALTLAPLNSPIFTGNPTAPTPPMNDNDTSIATTAFVINQGSNMLPTMDGAAAAGTAMTFSRGDHVHATDTTRAPLASPVFTGNPTAPTPAPGDNDTSIATTAFVTNAVIGAVGGNLPAAGTLLPLINATPAVVGTSAAYSREDHVHPTDTSRYAATNPSGYQTAAQVTTTVNASLGAYLPLAGGILTGVLGVNLNAAASPSAPFAGINMTLADGVGGGFSVDSFATSGAFCFRRANGTNAAKTALVSGDVIGAITWRGADPVGISASNNAGIRAHAAENWADATHHGTFLSFLTSPLATNSIVEGMRVHPSGGVGIGAAAISADPGVNNLAIAGKVTSTTISTFAGPGQWAAAFTGNVAAGQSSGLLVSAGTNAADYCFYMANAANNLAIMYAYGNGTVAVPGTINSGPHTVAGRLTVQGPNVADWAAVMTGGSTAGQSLGLMIRGGTNVNDSALGVYNQAGNVTFLSIDGTGKVTIPSGQIQSNYGSSYAFVTGGNFVSGANNYQFIWNGNYAGVNSYMDNQYQVGVLYRMRFTVNTALFYLDSSGTAGKPGGGAWVDSSDIRIKNVVGEYKSGLDEISKLRPIIYTFKGNDTHDPPLDGPVSKDAKPHSGPAPYPNSTHYGMANETKYVGLIAQELENVLPGMVNKLPGFIDGQEVDDLRIVDYSAMIFTLINAVKELKARIEVLEAV